MATRYIGVPDNASPRSANFPQPLVFNTTERVPALAYDATTQEFAVWRFILPAGAVGPFTIDLYYVMISATSGNVVMRASVQAISSGDVIDLSAATSYDTANSTTDAVPGSAKNPKKLTITLTNNDAMVAGELISIAIDRDAANGSDTAAGDLYLLAWALQDAA